MRLHAIDAILGYDAPTPRQLEIAVALGALTDRLGEPPTVRELLAEVGGAIAPLHRRLCTMRHKGIVTWEPFGVRTLRLTRNPQS